MPRIAIPGLADPSWCRTPVVVDHAFTRLVSSYEVFGIVVFTHWPSTAPENPCRFFIDTAVLAKGFCGSMYLTAIVDAMHAVVSNSWICASRKREFHESDPDIFDRDLHLFKHKLSAESRQRPSEEFICILASSCRVINKPGLIAPILQISPNHASGLSGIVMLISETHWETG